MLRKIHLVTGFVFLILFLATGKYMQMNFPDIYQDSEVMRFMYRANHIYILMAALMNLILGSYLVVSGKPRVKFVQYIASIILIMATCLLFTAFWVEPARLSEERDFTFYGVVLMFGSVMFHIIAGLMLNTARKTQ